MVFQTIDVSGHGPFAQEQLIHFSRSCNLIQGPNGTGKTTINAELMRVFKSGFTHKTVSLDQALSLCFIGEDYRDNLRRPSVLLDLLRIAAETNSSETSDALTFHINRLMEGNCRYGKLVATVTARGDVDSCDDDGSSRRSYFQSGDTSFVLVFAINLAVRDVLRFHEPIVGDAAFSYLDDVTLSTCFQMVMERSEQSIILEPQSVFDRIHVRPDLTIVVNAEGFSEIRGRSV